LVASLKIMKHNGKLIIRKYLDFSFKEGYISIDNYEKGKGVADEIGAMLWKELINLKNRVK